VDVVTSREFSLDAPVAEVWRQIINYPSWQGYTSVEHVSGPPGQEGEVVLLGKLEGELVWQPKYCRTLRLDPPHQVIWKVYPPRDNSEWAHEFTATVDYRLSQLETNKTRVAVQVIKEFSVPYADAGELDEVRKQESELQASVEDTYIPKLAEALRSHGA
jgi:hypothetical protein